MHALKFSTERDRLLVPLTTAAELQITHQLWAAWQKQSAQLPANCGSLSFSLTQTRKRARAQIHDSRFYDAAAPRRPVHKT